MGKWQSRWTRIALVLIGAFALTGCETLLPRGEGPVVEQPSQPAETQPAPVEEAAPDLSEPIPVDRERHRVALLLPLSGNNAAVGQSIANATTLALLDTSADNIRLTNYDTSGGAAAAARQAIADGNKLILGPLLGDNVQQVASIAKPNGVPIISYSNDVSVAGDPGIFLLGYNPAQSIDRVVQYAKAQGITRFAGIVPSGVYGQRASSALLRSVADAGGTVTALQEYDRTNTSIEQAVGRLGRDAEFQAVLIADSGAMARRIAPMVRAQAGPAIQILGTDLWNTDNDLTSGSALQGAWFASVSDNLYRQYAAKYRGRYGTNPFRLSSLGYDSVLLTFRIARDWRVGSPFPVEMLRDSGGYVGLDGAFRFDDRGIAERALEVQRVSAGAIQVIDPAPSGF